MSQRATRRAFLSNAAAIVVGGWCGLAQPWLRQLHTWSQSGLRITEIERYEVVFPFNDFNAKQCDQRTLCQDIAR